MPTQPTIAELRAEFKRCRLWVIGWSFERAMQTPTIVKTLICAIHARQRHQQACGQPIPQQPRLI